MNTVNETKTFSSLPEEESALWERMRDTLLCLQTDNSISVKDLASRLAYSTQEFLYLADIFFDNSLDAIREQVQGLNIEEDYTNQVLPFERIPDSSMIEYKVVRRMAQTVEADMLPLEGDVFQNGMEYIEKDVKEKWKERERAGEYMQFWWHDDSYHFFYMIGQEVPKDAGRKSEKKRIDFGASDYAMKNKKEEKKIYGVDEWISYIDEHITENLTAKGLAKLFHYSEKHLKNIFQLYYETRITDYIKQRKLYFAAEELKEGKNPEKVCAKYQFASYSVFSNAFRKEYGVVPAKYYRMEFQNIAWINYIDEHITEDITPEMMAEHFNYSRDYFRKAFQDDFGMGLSAYISQRKIQKAARELRQGVKVASLAKKYGFKSRNGFDKAFRKAFCTSPSKYAKANTEVVDLNQFYSEYKDKMKVSFMDVDDIKMVGWTIIPNRGREVDIPAQVAFWLDEDSPYFKKMNSVAGSTNGNDKIAMWYHDPECINIQYILGPVVNNFTNVPDDAVKIEIAAGRFAVFETDRESDVDNLADTIRMFSRCVFYGWIKEHRDMVSLQNFTFERYINKKVYIYVPISVK